MVGSLSLRHSDHCCWIALSIKGANSFWSSFLLSSGTWLGWSVTVVQIVVASPNISFPDSENNVAILEPFASYPWTIQSSFTTERKPYSQPNLTLKLYSVYGKRMCALVWLERSPGGSKNCRENAPFLQSSTQQSKFLSDKLHLLPYQNCCFVSERVLDK